MNNNTLYVFCGIPGSGKTTTSKELALSTGAKLYCFDDIPESRNPMKSQDLKDEMYRQICIDLALGRDIILDDLNTKKSWRQDLLNVIENIPCKKILIVLSTPLEECLRRNRQRLNKIPDLIIQILNRKFDKPTLDEGWDEILWR